MEVLAAAAGTGVVRVSSHEAGEHLEVDAMVFALTCAYLAVVRIDAWPISTWMMRMSVPVSSRCVAKAWRSPCAVSRFFNFTAFVAR